MKVKLKEGTSALEVIKDLEEHLGPSIPHERNGQRGFFQGRNWRIDHAITHWELHLDRRHSTKPWFTLFLLRWC